MSVNNGTAGATAGAGTNDFVMVDATGVVQPEAPVDDTAKKEAVVDEKAEAKETKEPAEQSKAQDDADQGEDAEGDGDKPKKKSGYQRKIEKLERRIAEMEKAAGGNAGAKAKEADAAPSKEEAAPKLSDFESYDEYTQAVAEHRAKKAVAEALKSREEADRNAKVKAQFEGKLEAYEKAKEAFRQVQPDFDEAVEAYDGEVSEHMQYAVLETDIPAEVTYYLVTHPEEATAIARLGITGANRAVGAIEARLKLQAEQKAAAASDANKEPAKVKTTNAPAPIKPVTGKGPSASSTSLEAAADESFEAYERLRRKR